MDKDDENIERLDGLSSKFNNLQNELASNQKRLEENKKQLEELTAQLSDDEEVPEDLCMEEQVQQAESAVLFLNAKVKDKSSQLGSAHEVKNYLRYCIYLESYCIQEVNIFQFGSQLPEGEYAQLLVCLSFLIISRVSKLCLCPKKNLDLL